MKFAFYLVVAIILTALLSVFAAQYIQQDFGYVYIKFRGYQIEMSVVMLGMLLLALVAAIWLVRRIFMAPRLIGEAAGRYRAARAGDKLMRGMIEVAEGNFAKGEKLLGRAATTSDAPLFNYLQAARAAHLQGNVTRRDEWLKLAYEDIPGAGNAVLLTQAELQIDSEQHEEAVATLRKLDENSHNHGYALVLLGKVYFNLGDWTNLADALPRIQKHGRIDAATLEAWTLRVHSEALRGAADADALGKAYAAVPRKLLSKPTILEDYFESLIRTQQHDKAEAELGKAIGKEWRGFLVRLFGKVEGSDPSKQLTKAEGWLNQHPEDPDLLLAAARLCLRNELWGKARSYLESVITLRPSPEAYQVYGKLLNQLGESDAAAEAFRDGLGLVSAEPLPAIPHLEPDPS
ncbi:MAG: heme biosynthesis HemY N-terminal domain-containing protein [Pseudomonadota bacterium]